MFSFPLIFSNFFHNISLNCWGYLKVFPLLFSLGFVFCRFWGFFHILSPSSTKDTSSSSMFNTDSFRSGGINQDFFLVTGRNYHDIAFLVICVGKSKTVRYKFLLHKISIFYLFQQTSIYLVYLILTVCLLCSQNHKQPVQMKPEVLTTVNNYQ